MRIGSIDTNESVLVIAEIGNNHEGDFGRASEMIQAAAQAGADAVKFQTIVPARLVATSQTERIAQLSRFQFSYQQFEQLAGVCHDNGVMFLSTPFDLDSALFLAPLVPAFKIASSDNTFYPLLATVVATDKPVIMSAGLCDAEELAASIEYLRVAWETADVEDKLAVLHCVTAYPTPLDQAGLGAISAIAKLGVTPGYSDHTLGIEAAVLAVACGARIIEKHFTLDKNLSDFRDHQLSADPAELSVLVSRIRKAEKMLGCPDITCADCEAPNKDAVRRSIVARNDLALGTVLDMQHLDWVRPGIGLAPGLESALLGCKLTRAVQAGEPIMEQDVE